MDTTTPPPVCPAHRTLPLDGTPLAPSPRFAQWRSEAPATPFHYPDGHDGWIVTDHALAQTVLAHPEFSQLPHRMTTPWPDAPADPLDERGEAAMRAANLLALDEPDHVRLRRHITSRFSVRSVRSRTEEIAAIVAAAAARLRALGSPADVFEHFARPISVAVHALVLGIPDHRIDDFDRLFADPSTSQEKADFVRAVLDERRGDPGEDVVSDLLSSELTDAEIEGLVMVLMTSGRDSVAYMISTLTVALLTNPDQLDAVRRDPSLVPGAVEEIMRFGAMFVTLFPRPAVRDLELDGLAVRAGQTVSVSAAAANRDPARFDEPDRFDVQRDSFGHLGFGHGSHGCVGQQLARREVAEAIGALVTGFPGLRLVSAEQLAPMPFAHPVATYEAGEVLVAWD